MRRTLAYLVTAAAVSLAAAPAHAQTACNTLTNPIYITGSTALEPLLKQLGPKVAADSPAHTIVYLKTDGSCGGVNRIISTGTGTINQNMLYIPAGFNPATDMPASCTVDPAAPVPISLVLSDVDPSLCPGAPTIPGYKDFQGPVNAMAFVVPTTSQQKHISAEEAYLVLGLGDQGMVSPWIDPNFYFIRPKDSGTRAMIAANIGTTTHDWKGVYMANGKNFGSGDVLNNVAGVSLANAEKTIGILGMDFLDTGSNHNSANSLAFRAFHQHYAYWPDSVRNGGDRINVREGRYAIWGYVHMLAQYANNAISDAAALYFINIMTGATPAPGGADIDDISTDAHLVPVCAMKVARDIEGGPMRAADVAAPCGCSFEKRATGHEPAGCTACSATTPCSTGVCRKGYCEAK
jgi:hypothetical protein